MEKEGNSALKWYKDNYLLFNPEKLNTIGIKRRNETEQINTKIGDQAIKTTDNIKLPVSYTHLTLPTKRIV